MRNANRFEEPSYFRDRNPHTNLHYIAEKNNCCAKQKQLLYKKMQLLRKKDAIIGWTNLIIAQTNAIIVQKKQLLCKKKLFRKKKQLLQKINNYCAKKMHLSWEKKNCCAKKKQLLWKKYVFDETTRMFKLHFKLSFYRHIYILCTYLILRISRFLWFILSFLYQIYNGGPKIAPKNNDVK